MSLMRQLGKIGISVFRVRINSVRSTGTGSSITGSQNRKSVDAFRPWRRGETCCRISGFVNQQRY